MKCRFLLIDFNLNNLRFFLILKSICMFILQRKYTIKFNLKWCIGNKPVFLLPLKNFSFFIIFYFFSHCCLISPVFPAYRLNMLEIQYGSVPRLSNLVKSEKIFLLWKDEERSTLVVPFCLVSFYRFYQIPIQRWVFSIFSLITELFFLII